ncbi:hypothetical protein EVA_02463 [gut metagenome]|uniref:DUF4988 domain-containing protein n=1 Tax=gut metagenome TaxID=749906 RepID=J9GP12_9ZZZZ
MKNLVKMLFLTGMLGMLWSCEYDDDDLWNKVQEVDGRVESLEKAVAKMNDDIASLRTIVDALNEGKVITHVEQLNNGYKLTFNDNSTVVLEHGTNGADAPVIGVKVDEDGVYYWTQTVQGKTEWLLDDNKQKIPVKGADGAAGVTPVMAVDAEGYWTADTGRGPVRVLNAAGEPVKAVPNHTEVLFTDIQETKDSVTLVLANGSTITIPKISSLSIGFADGGNQVIKVGQKKEFLLTTSADLDYCKIIDITDGWQATLSSSQGKTIDHLVLSVTAPASLTEALRHCEIRILVSDEAGNCKLSKLHLSCVDYELRILTFEDADAKFTQYDMGYCGVTVSTWSDLIDTPQYGGPMLYGDFTSSEYTWWDEGNTELMHIFPYNYKAYCYYGGGHALSHYNSKNYLKFGDYNSQLTVFNPAAGDDMNQKGGGHNGSDNFVMHYGYKDGSAFNLTEFLPALTFADGEARVIDHMYVNNSTYALNTYLRGNGLTEKIGPEDWVKIVAIGYDVAGDKTGETFMYLCNGPENIVRDWIKWDLSSLGKVVSVEFNVTGSSDNGYGFSQPAYFAYDDVCVRF